MMSRKQIAAVICLLASAATAAAEQPRRVFVMGMGRSSCATWLADASSEAEGNVWLLGFWTGSNVGNSKAGTVGHSTDARGILGSVKKKCLEDPAATVFSVASDLFDQFQRDGR